MATAFKGGGKELVHYLTCRVFANKAAWHYQHIGIIVLTGQMSYLCRPHKGSPNLGVLVESHADAFAATADSYACGQCLIVDGLAQFVGKVGVVTAILVIAAKVLILDTFLCQVALHILFQGITGMVRC